MAKDIKRLHFNSLLAMSQFIANTNPCGYFANSECCSCREKDSTTRFTKTKTFPEADGLLTGGWIKGANQVKKYTAKVNTPGIAPAPANVYGVAGFAPSVGRAVTGNPCNMMMRKKINKIAPVVEITYNVSVSGSVAADDLIQASSKLFNVISALERGGVRVGLRVVEFGHAGLGDECTFISVDIKRPDQPFNLLKMIYPFVHPSFLRRHLFAVIERAGVVGDWDGYGYPITKPDDVLKYLGYACKNYFYYNLIKDLSEQEIKDMIK